MFIVCERVLKLLNLLFEDKLVLNLLSVEFDNALGEDGNKRGKELEIGVIRGHGGGQMLCIHNNKNKSY